MSATAAPSIDRLRQSDFRRLAAFIQDDLRHAVGYLVKVTGSYAAGMLFLAVLMVLGALLCIPLRGAKVLADESA